MSQEVKQYFLDQVAKGGDEFRYLLYHVPEVEKWARKILKEYPKANEEIVLSSVWLHDAGLLVGDQDTDHAINSEKVALSFLPTITDQRDVVEKIAHCVRSHRCKDIMPQTIEAKIVAISDSLSHMTDVVYINMYQRGETAQALEKLERDNRDKSLIKLSFTPQIEIVYQNWKNLLLSLNDLN